MTQADIAALMEGIAPVMRGFVEASFRPLADQLAAMQKRLEDDAPVLAALRSEIAAFGPMLEERAAALGDGLQAALDGMVKALPPPHEPDAAEIKALVDEAVAELPKPQDGKSVTAADVRPLVAELVGAAVAEIPAPRDGRDADPEAIKVLVADAVAALPPPAPGKDADPATMAGMVKAAIAELMTPLQAAVDAAILDVRAVNDAAAIELREACERSIAELPKVPTAEEVAALMPKPKDGASVTIDDLRPVIEKALAELPAPKDGVGLAGAVIDREGNLVVTLTDGSTKELGRIVGDPGKDGADGFGFDDMEAVPDGERGVLLRFTRGERVKEFRFAFPVLIDRGVFKDGADYVAGDCVTFGGSLWTARGATNDRPGTSDAWRLSVKKGRDGKDGAAPRPPTPVKLK